MTDAAGPEDVYDWNAGLVAGPARVDLHDETLRAAARCPSAATPSLADRAALLAAMVRLGVRSASLGSPAASEREASDCTTLARSAREAALPLILAAAARALPADVAAVAAVRDGAATPVAAEISLGLSPLRRRAEGRSVADLRSTLTAAFAEARRRRLRVAFVAQDAARTEPAVLRDAMRLALDAGVRCLVIDDDAGHATPDGAARLVRFVRHDVLEGARVRVEWHGRGDRGLALANCLAAASAGASSVHGTALGIGERSGDAALELLAVNLFLAGSFAGQVREADSYVRLASTAFGIAVPAGHPVFGVDATLTVAAPDPVATVPEAAR